MTSLKLMALDEEDLQILSAHLQDALLRADEMAWEPGAHRIVAMFNRFDWQKALAAEGQGAQRLERRRSALRFDRVLKVSSKNIKLGDKAQILELLAIRFIASDEPPGGIVELVFASDSMIRLQVEVIEASLTDLGPGWEARSKPTHDEG